MSVRNCQSRSPPNLFLLNSLIVSLLALGAYSYRDCKYFTRVGSTYKVNCTYYNNQNTTTAYNLRLRRLDTRIVLNNRIVNNNTIEYEWPNIPRISVDIECSYIDDKVKTGVWIKKVIAESPPVEVKFGCISNDFQYLKCHYDKPIQNFTTIQLLPINCVRSPNESANSCTLSQPDYDPINQDTYNFTVHSKNCFGEIFQNFSINHFDSVIPGKPNVSVSAIKPNSVTLRLTLHDKIYLKTGLYYEIKLEQRFHPYGIRTWNSIHSKQIQSSFEITDLYAFKRYTIRVRSRSLTSKNATDLWSLPIIIDIDTPPKPPEIPPKIDAGCFYVGPDQDVHIYWETVPEIEHNGDNFAYEIGLTRLNGNVSGWWERLPKESFTTIYYLPRTNYKIRLRSVNDIGSSHEVFIDIPMKDYPKPRRVRSTFDGATYQLSWDPPDTGQEILESYTVSRCELDGPNEGAVNCSKDFHFVRVAITVGNFTFTKGNQFAVSANYLNGSSEMVWIECIGSVKSDIGSITTLQLDVINSTTIYAYWALTCIQRTLVKGHRIHYCESNTNTCSHKIIGPDQEDVFISSLTPNTEYQIQVSIYSETMDGSFSEFLTAKTHEEVSTAPRNLKICNISEDTIELTWMSPEHLNGELRHYKVWYNDRYIQLTQKQYLTAQIITYNLTNLKSNEDYRISVVAGTISDSERSNEVSARTTISDPGLSLVTIYERIDSNHFKIGWTSTKSSSSDMKISEIAITNIKNNQTEIQIVNDIYEYGHELNCSKRCSACEYQISVRVVNIGFEKQIRECTINVGTLVRSDIRNSVISFIDKQDFSQSTELEQNLNRFLKQNDTIIRFVYGSWSELITHSCVLKDLSSAALFPAVGIFSFLFSASFVVYYFRRRYKIAREIGIILPKGLTNEDSTDDKCQPEKMDASDVSDDYFSCQAYIDKSELFEDMFKDATPPFSTNSERYILRYMFADESKPLVSRESKMTVVDHESEPNFVCNGYVRPEDLKSLKIDDCRPKEMFSQISIPHNDMFDSNGYVLKSALADEKRIPLLSKHFRNLPLTTTGYISPKELENKYCSESKSIASNISITAPDSSLKDSIRPITEYLNMSDAELVTDGNLKDNQYFTERPHQQKRVGSDGYIVKEDLQRFQPKRTMRTNQKQKSITDFHPAMFNENGYIVTGNFADESKPFVSRESKMTAVDHESEPNFVCNGYVRPEDLKSLKIGDCRPKDIFSQISIPHSDMFDSNGYVLKSALADEKKIPLLSKHFRNPPLTTTGYISPKELENKYCAESKSIASNISITAPDSSLKDSIRPITEYLNMSDEELVTDGNLEDNQYFTERPHQQERFGFDGYIVKEDLQRFQPKPTMRTKQNKQKSITDFHPAMFNANGYIVTGNTFLNKGYISPKKLKNMASRWS